MSKICSKIFRILGFFKVNVCTPNRYMIIEKVNESTRLSIRDTLRVV